MSNSDRNEKKKYEARHNNKGQPPGISLDAAQEDKGLFDAFLSYSRRDRESADQLIKLLEAKGARIAFDQDDIRGGEDWRRKLKNLIEHSQNVVFLISPASLVSQVCHWELDLSVTLNKRLIPVLVGADVPADLPESLSVVQWIDARNERSEVAVGEILDALHTEQTWTEVHTQLGLRAQAWSKEDGALLRGRELRTFEALIALYQGKRPVPTNQQTVFLTESRRAARRRLQ